MFCKNCGEEINDNDRFCSKCGSSVEMVRIQAKKKNYKIPVAFMIIVLIIATLVFLFSEKRFEHNVNGKMDIGFGLGMTENEFIKESGIDDFKKAETNGMDGYVMEIPEKGAWYATQGNIITDIALWDFESDLCIEGIYVGQSFTEACEMAEEREYMFGSDSTLTRSGSDIIYETYNYEKNGTTLQIVKDDQGRVMMINKYF